MHLLLLSDVLFVPLPSKSADKSRVKKIKNHQLACWQRKHYKMLVTGLCFMHTHIAFCFILKISI